MTDIIYGLSIGMIVLSGLGFLARWAWNHTHERIRDGREETRKITDAILVQLREHEQEDRLRHDEVIKVTTRIDTQLGRFISDIESEKRTRAEVNREVFVKLERINERLQERRDQGRPSGR